ncbi:hypothetical protein VULLAG_LOCUS21544 [Vulpes lagopus]
MDVFDIRHWIPPMPLVIKGRHQPYKGCSEDMIAQSQDKELVDHGLEKRVKGWFRMNSRKNDLVATWRRTRELNPMVLRSLGRKF